ncbi:MAG: hypothetical protein A2Y17_00685 [Clostridiales bacterium GWF2_38_85]|nr:MAG: hypothetical protein A2Y17_00685 [Clostridiales bacterium GWF2_38_85]
MIQYIVRPFQNNDIMIKTDDPTIVETLKIAYGCYVVDFTEKECIQIFIIKTKKMMYEIYCDNKKTVTETPLQLIENMIFDTTFYYENIFALHAGAVSVKDNTLIFIAPTGGGKTTLISYLSIQGFEYVTDDCVFIDMNNNNVYPYHKPIHLRKGGYNIIKNHLYDLDEIHEIYNDGNKRYVYSPSRFSKNNLRLNKIFFIERNEKINELCNMTTNEAIQKLMASTITSYSIKKEYLKFLSIIARECRILKYKDLDYVYDILEYRRYI